MNNNTEHTHITIQNLARALNVTVTQGEQFERDLYEAIDRTSPDDLSTIIARIIGADDARAYEPIVMTSDAPSNKYELADDVAVCTTCNDRLSPYTDNQGNLTGWVHSKRWKNYDHQPQAHMIARADAIASCDFCGLDTTLTWQYITKEAIIHDPLANETRNFGTHWGACDICHSHIAANDIAGLVDRIVRLSPGLRDAPTDVKEINRRRYLALHNQVIPTIHTRTYLGELPPPPRMHPREVPKIRDGLIKFWTSNVPYSRFINAGKNQHLPGHAFGDDSRFRVTTPHDQPLTQTAFNAHRDHLVHGLTAAGLYYVSSDFTRLAISSGQELPDLTITREELPATSGFLIYQEPVTHVVRGNGHTAGIRAISWTLVPAGVWFNIYFQPEDGDPSAEDTRAELGWLSSPNCGVGLPFGVAMTPDHNNSGHQVMATILATFFLIAQPGVTTETTERANPRLTRAYKRAGRPAPDVRVVDLRQRTAAEQRAAQLITTATRKLSVRFLVRGHWKRQAYGPARSLRKSIYVQPIIKGPAGAPLKTTPTTVKVLR